MKTPTLTRIGVGNFDKAPKITDLKFKLPKANRLYMKDLKTNDKLVIEKVIKSGILREVNGIQERNEARKYAANRVENDDFKSDGAYHTEEQSNRGSEFGRSSHYSPNKSTKQATQNPLKVSDASGLQSALKQQKLDN